MNSQKSFKIIIFGTLLLTLNIGCSDSQEVVDVKFGVLPVIQALPLFVAVDKGFFTEASLNVELVNFRSAMEVDIALTAGKISGYFGDLVTPIILKSNSTPVRIAASFTNTIHNQRMFALLQPPGVDKISVAEAAKLGIATSSNTVVDYFIYLLLGGKEAENATDYKIVETKNIPIRLQLLLSGQFAAAVLSEPLVTFAEMNGAQVIAEDRGMPFSITTLSFTDKFLKDSPERARSFMQAVARSIKYIEANPDSVRQIMNAHVNVPKELQDSIAIPNFPEPALPDSEQLNNVINWLIEKEIIKSDIHYEDLIARELY